MTEQSFDLRRLLHTMRRRWIWLAGLVVLGVSCGWLVTVLQRPAFEARALVLLPPSTLDAQGRPLRSMETEAHIASAADVLDRAGQRFSPPITARALRKRVHTRDISSDLLEVRAEAGRAGDARLLANAVADEYISYSNGAAFSQANSTVNVLQAQATDLDRRIRQLESDIAAGTSRLAGVDPRSAEGLRQAALLEAMRFEQVDASRHLATVSTKINDARLEAELNSRGTRLLEPAETPAHPSRPRPLWDIGGGALVGLVAAGLLAVGLDRTDGRLRRRDDIAEAVGAPVLASLSVPRRAGAARCRVLLDRWEPTVIESLALRQAFSRLGVADEQPPVNIVVVTLPGDRAAPLLAAELALFAATFDASTALVVASGHASTNEIRAACTVRRGQPLRPGLSVHDLAVGNEPAKLEGVEVSIAIVVADGGPLVLPTWDRRTLTALAVSSGFATPDALAAAALACADAGEPVRGVFVANPDPNDRTTGRIGLPSRPTPGVVRRRGKVRDLPPPRTHDPNVRDGPPDMMGREAAP